MIKKVLFDVDGVLLSEEHYFDASALTVWELLYSDNYLGLSPEKYRTDFSEKEIAAIREEVFEADQVLKFLKSRGLNANWDMIYLTFSYQLIVLLEQIQKTTDQEYIKKWLSSEIDRSTLQEIGYAIQNSNSQPNFKLFVKDFERSNATKQGLMGYLDQLVKEKLGINTSIFQEKGCLWSVGEHVSQEWYVGDENVLTSTGRPSVQLGKKGFLSQEKTLCPKEQISELFKELEDTGVKLGIGTGRPELETIQPFEQLGWLGHFPDNYIATADDVLKAEKEFPERKSLSKPHPFTYILSFYGKDFGFDKCLSTALPIEKGEEVLIVGDSLADLLAARQMGCQFAAVLTGLSGKAARSEFEKHQADYILDNVLDVANLIQRRG